MWSTMRSPRTMHLMKFLMCFLNKCSWRSTTDSTFISSEQRVHLALSVFHIWDKQASFSNETFQSNSSTAEHFDKMKSPSSGLSCNSSMKMPVCNNKLLIVYSSISVKINSLLFNKFLCNLICHRKITDDGFLSFLKPCNFIYVFLSSLTFSRDIFPHFCLNVLFGSL